MEVTITPADTSAVAPEAITEEVILPSEEVAELSYEDLKKAYDELKNKPAETTAEAPKASAIEALTALLKEKGDNLSEEDYTSLASQGLSKNDIETYVSGIKAKEIAAFEAVLAPYGTMKDYADATVYVANTWTVEQIEAYNEAITTGSDKVKEFAISALMGQYKASLGETPNALITKTKPNITSGIKPYEDRTSMNKDINNPKYGKDAAYTRKVEERLFITDLTKF